MSERPRVPFAGTAPIKRRYVTAGYTNADMEHLGKKYQDLGYRTGYFGPYLHTRMAWRTLLTIIILTPSFIIGVGWLIDLSQGLYLLFPGLSSHAAYSPGIVLIPLWCILVIGHYREWLDVPY